MTKANRESRDCTGQQFIGSEGSLIFCQKGMSRLVKPKEAAAYLAISERTLWNLTKVGTIAAVKLARAVRYDLRDLDNFIQAAKKTSC